LEEIESNKEVKGIILSGGPDIEKAKNCIDIALNAKLPILGICLGHQLIASAPFFNVWNLLYIETI